MAGKKASRELNATCWAEPQASSATNSLHERLSRLQPVARGRRVRRRRDGAGVGAPVSRRRQWRTRRLRPSSSPRGRAARGGASSRRCRRRGRSRRRAPRRRRPAASRQLPGDVGRLAEPGAQRLDRAGELAPAPPRCRCRTLGGASVRGCHCLLIASCGQLCLLGSPAREPAACPRWTRQPDEPEARRRAGEGDSDDQQREPRVDGTSRARRPLSRTGSRARRATSTRGRDARARRRRRARRACASARAWRARPRDRRAPSRGRRRPSPRADGACPAGSQSVGAHAISSRRSSRAGCRRPARPPITTNGFGPEPVRRGRFPSCGPARRDDAGPGFWSVGASPFARAAIRLGFSLRTKAASSASGSASFASGRRSRLPCPRRLERVGRVDRRVGFGRSRLVARRCVISWRAAPRRSRSRQMRDATRRAAIVAAAAERGVETGPEQLAQHAAVRCPPALAKTSSGTARSPEAGRSCPRRTSALGRCRAVLVQPLELGRARSARCDAALVDRRDALGGHVPRCLEQARRHGEAVEDVLPGSPNDLVHLAELASRRRRRRSQPGSTTSQDDGIGHQTSRPPRYQTGPCVPTGCVSESAARPRPCRGSAPRPAARGSGAPSRARRRSRSGARRGSGSAGGSPARGGVQRRRGGARPASQLVARVELGPRRRRRSSPAGAPRPRRPTTPRAAARLRLGAPAPGVGTTRARARRRCPRGRARRRSRRTPLRRAPHRRRPATKRIASRRRPGLSGPSSAARAGSPRLVAATAERASSQVSGSRPRCRATARRVAWPSISARSTLTRPWPGSSKSAESPRSCCATSSARCSSSGASRRRSRSAFAPASCPASSMSRSARRRSRSASAARSRTAT